MSLWIELLVSALKSENIEINFSNNDVIKEIVELKCYKILSKIKRVLEDEFIDDYSRCNIIKEILKVFEDEHMSCKVPTY